MTEQNAPVDEDTVTPDDANFGTLSALSTDEITELIGRAPDAPAGAGEGVPFVRVSVIDAPGRPDLEGRSWLTSSDGHTELPQEQHDPFADLENDPLDPGPLPEEEAEEVEADEAPEHPHPLLSFFAVGHLDPRIKGIVSPFAQLAALIDRAPPSLAKNIALQHLCDAKDWAVRAQL